jgi:hypothetical protein
MSYKRVLEGLTKTVSMNVKVGIRDKLGLIYYYSFYNFYGSNL